MEIGMKAFYQQPRQARRAMETLKERGLHVNRVHYYKKKKGGVEYFHARGNVAKRIAKAFVFGALGGFALGAAGGFILLFFDIVPPFQDMNFLGTVVAIGVIGAFTLPAFTTALAAVFSEDAVDLDEGDFNGDQVVVDFHVENDERDQAESLLKKTGAHNILSE